MKVETLQTYSVAILLLGLLLAAVGGFGAYYFSSKSDRIERLQAASVVQTVDSRVMRLLARQQAVETKLESLERLAAAPTAPPSPPIEVARPDPVATSIPGIEPRPVATSTPKPVRDVEPRPIATAASKPAPSLMPSLEPFPIAKATAKPAPKPRLEPLPVAVGPKSASMGKTAIEPARQQRSKPATDLRTSLKVLGLSSQQGAAFVRRLRAQRGRTVALHVPEGRFDALDRAQALKQVFLAADWSVTGVQEIRSRRPGNGMALSSGTFPPPMEVATILSALLSAGFKVETDLDPNQRQHRAVLFVGSK